MYDNLSIGEHAFIIEHSLYTAPVTVVRRDGEFCVLRLETGCYLRVRRSRLYGSEEEARAALPKRKRVRRFL